MKKAGRALLLFMVLVLTFNLALLQVKANESGGDTAVTELNQVMTVLVDCEARELPQRGSAGVMSYSAGSPVWVIGETADGWYLVSYQDEKGYIPKDYISELQVEVEDQGVVGLAEAGLDEEMTAVEAENKMVIEEIERQRGEAKRSHIWMIVIVLLVIGIFATGIISTVKAGKEKEKMKAKDEEPEDVSRKEVDSIEVIDLDAEEDMDS